MGNDVETSPNVHPAVLVGIGSVIALLFIKRHEIVERYDPVREAQRIARKAIGIED